MKETNCMDDFTLDVQMSGWWEVRHQTKDDWKSGTLVFGEQSATTYSTTLTLASSVIVLDTGWCWFDIIMLKVNMHSVNIGHSCKGRLLISSCFYY